MKKKTAFLVSAIIAYTVIVALSFAFIPKLFNKKEDNTNNFNTRSYSYVNYNSEEKERIYNSINLDIKKLKEKGFKLSNEKFLTPSDWPKELRVIQLFFENIYCSVTINIHEDEIGWERQRAEFNPAIKYAKVDINGIIFDRNENTLRQDDASRKVIFLFDCSIEPEDSLYKKFLILFLTGEDV